MRLPGACVSDRLTERCVARIYANQIAVCPRTMPRCSPKSKIVVQVILRLVAALVASPTFQSHDLIA